MIARDIMHRKVVTVAPQTALAALRALLDEHGITGVPVVGPEGDLIGMVSRTDLARADPAATRVESIMTPWVVCFEEDTPVDELARQMLVKHIHRVVITRQGRLAGIVSSMDLLRALLQTLHPKPDGHPTRG